MGDEEFLSILNGIPLDEIKILDSIIESKVEFDIEGHYRTHQTQIEESFRAMEDWDYRKYLDEMKLPYMEIDQVVSALITWSNEQKNTSDKKFNDVYRQFKSGELKSEWKFNAELKCYCNNLYLERNSSGFIITRRQDLLEMRGPFSIFSDPSDFYKGISVQSQSYYIEYFRDILKAFHSPYMLFADELCGIDLEDKTLDSKRLLQEYHSFKQEDYDQHSAMQYLYFENL